MARIKITMEMTPRPAFPADDLEALRQNTFDLLNRMRDQVLELRARFEIDAPTMSPEFRKAMRASFTEDLDAIQELVSSFEVEVVDP